MENRNISILGCGWYGLAMAKSLIKEGYNVKGSTTSLEKLAVLREAGIIAYLLNFDATDSPFDIDFFKCDILIISIPPGRNTPNLTAYPSKIKNIALQAGKLGVKQLIFISSTGVYQDGNFIVDESILPCPNTNSGTVMLEAEGILSSNLSFTTTIIRFGGLIGPGRNLAKHFAGKIEIANGLAPINLIHLHDCIGLTKTILSKKAFGKLYHGVAPEHPSRSAFYTQACLESGFEKPEFIAELLEWKQVESVNVPSILGYKWIVSFSMK